MIPENRTQNLIVGSFRSAPPNTLDVPFDSDDPLAPVEVLRSTSMKQIEMTMDTNERQEMYVKAQEAKGGGVGLVFADAFIRGMRDIGYKSPAWALAELVDNSLQAGATAVDIRFGFAKENSGRAKPDMLAVIDNGAGMIPKMISYAVRWGGTDRENNRQGFGRYGYGLPSSAVSLARRYSVYSKIAGGDWHVVTVDLGALANAASDISQTEKLLRPRKAELPGWLCTVAEAKGGINVTALDSGSIVVLEDIDRLKQMSGWITVNTLESKLLSNFGVVYRHWLAEKRILVNGKQTEVVDPLFLIPTGRFYDETSVLARPVYQHAFEVEASSGEKGIVRIRAALLPPDFQLADPAIYGQKGAKLTKRHEIMKAYNGLLVCREGRHIDCIPPEWTKFQTYDFNVKIEIDFDPTLDEYFGITTAKQQIVIDDRMWEKLKQSGKEAGGLHALLKDMRSSFEQLKDELEARVQQADSQDVRPSESAMAEAEKFRVRRATPTPSKVQAARQNLEEEVAKVSRETGKSVDTVRTQLEKNTRERLWDVEFESIEEGPFYIPKRMGAFQKRIIVNTSHPFYSKVYDQAPTIKSALEVLLFVLADGELDAEDEREAFYKNERQHWSSLLRHALDKLVDSEVLLNRASMVREQADSP
jgi:hypothetical protein